VRRGLGRLWFIENELHTGGFNTASRYVVDLTWLSAWWRPLRGLTVPNSTRFRPPRPIWRVLSSFLRF